MLEKMSVDDQVALISRASALIGIHGSGLAHAVWMAESRPGHRTFLIEVTPFGYVCRNWYEIAANAAGVKYVQLMNRRPPKEANEQLQACWKFPEMCPMQQCHDLLRDQSIELELDTLAEVWSPIAEELKGTITAE
jgi:hypothetical protein